jgi:hypothetical protein
MLLAGLVGAAVLALAVLPCPFSMLIERTRTAMRAHMALEIWGGLLGARLALEGSTSRIEATLIGRRLFTLRRLDRRSKLATQEIPAPPPRPLVERAAHLRASAVTAVDAARSIGPSVPASLARARRAVRLRGIDCVGTFGIPNPLVMGYATAAAAAIGPLLPDRAQMSIVPDFTRPGIEGRLHVRLWLSSARFAYALAPLVLRLGHWYLSRWRSSR